MIKKATVQSRVQADEHVDSFRLIEPYLKAFHNENVGFHYGVRQDKAGEFQGLAFVMPYLSNALEQSYLRPIFGLDSAHMKEIQLNKNKILKPMHLTAVTGRTLDNRMIPIAVALTYI